MLARIDTRPRRRNAGRPAEKSAPGFLQWLRGRDCHLSGPHGTGCSGKVRACHVDHAGGKGMASKVADMHAIPMCDGHHGDQHRIGWRSFERLHAFDAVAVAAAFWSKWPGRRAWEQGLDA